METGVDRQTSAVVQKKTKNQEYRIIRALTVCFWISLFYSFLVDRAVDFVSFCRKFIKAVNERNKPDGQISRNTDFEDRTIPDVCCLPYYKTSRVN